MGYTQDTHMSKFIPPAKIAQNPVATWTPALASNVDSKNRSAAAAEFTILIPIDLPSNDSALKGSLLKSIDIWWIHGTKDFTTAFTVALNKQTLPADTVALTGAAVTAVTLNHTEAEAYVVGSHKETITLTTPVWIDADESYFVAITTTAQDTTSLKVFGARANYTARM